MKKKITCAVPEKPYAVSYLQFGRSFKENIFVD